MSASVRLSSTSAEAPAPTHAFALLHRRSSNLLSSRTHTRLMLQRHNSRGLQRTASVRTSPLERRQSFSANQQPKQSSNEAILMADYIAEASRECRHVSYLKKLANGVRTAGRSVQLVVDSHRRSQSPQSCLRAWTS